MGSFCDESEFENFNFGLACKTWVWDQNWKFHLGHCLAWTLHGMEGVQKWLPDDLYYLCTLLSIRIEKMSEMSNAYMIWIACKIGHIHGLNVIECQLNVDSNSFLQAFLTRVWIMLGHSEIFDKEIGKVCDACIIWVAIGYIHSCQSISISLSLSFMFVSQSC